MPDDDGTDLALALAADPELSRPAAARLAADPQAWRRSDGRRSAAGAARLRVSASELAQARRRSRRAHQIARRERRRAERKGWRLLFPGATGWPTALDELQEVPPALWCRGRLPDRPAIAIVGSRRADPYGLEAARWFARELAAVGLTIVSGFARGVDATAHRGALEATDGCTVAVLGCGLDIDYPTGQRPLARRIAEAGAVLSEFPPGTPPLSHHFPVRNRVIAALAHGVLVVQAAARSGSLITARLALELGRDVYAIPGTIFQERALGANALIRDGALPALHPRDIVESLPQRIAERLRPEAAEEEPEAEPVHPLLAHLDPGEPRTVDALAAAAGRPAAEVLGALLELELTGVVRRHPGPAFTRTAGRGLGDMPGSTGRFDGTRPTGEDDRA